MNVTGITDATGAHIHQGKIGENGDVIVDLQKVSKHSDTEQGDEIERKYHGFESEWTYDRKSTDRSKGSYGYWRYIRQRTFPRPYGWRYKGAD
jgi:hypothetical protein